MNDISVKSRRNTKIEEGMHYEEALALLRKCSETRSIDEALQIITDEACKLAGGNGGSIWLISSEDASRIILRWTYRREGPNKVGTSYYTNKLDCKGNYEGLTAWVFATGNPLCIQDITNEEEIKQYEHLKWVDKYGGYKQATMKENQKHFMAVPIFSCHGNRNVIGVLRLGATNTENPFTDSDLHILQTYSGYISGLLTNFLKREEEKKLLDMFFAVASQADIDILLQESVRTIPIVMDGSFSSIFLKNDEGDLCLEATSAPHLVPYTRKNAKDGCLKYKPGFGKTGGVGLTGISCRVSGNITSSANVNHDLCECGVSSSAFLCSPIWDRNAQPNGVIRVVRDLHMGQEFDQEDENFLESFGQKLHKCLSVNGYFTKGTCFMLMPFGKGLDGIYSNVVKPTVQEFGFVCNREDEFASIGMLQMGIVSHIANAAFIIADLTGKNPNVFYELGIAHTLDKLVILLSQEDCPADIRHWKYISYSDKMEHAKILEMEIRKAIQEALDKNLIMSSRKKASEC